ncbi:hypothetical protein [Butyrivibrio sp. AE3004]|uniref:hypothetical protein n=1 Tax=Butyrivibrio sp. AE3004 TaxID=1506994 RepID=UPI0004940005|nr:hypothetical protein [Butyrivibrio sp. AE3004]
MKISDKQVKIEIISDDQKRYKDVKQSIFEIEEEIKSVSPHADDMDYYMAIASGVICGLIDNLWVGEFGLAGGREIASDKAEEFVMNVSKKLGYEGDNLGNAVHHLEKKFGLPADSNTPDFGGGLQHHLRDFAHHPTVLGLFFSLLTQFTYMSYGTDTNGLFKIVPVRENGLEFIGETLPEKVFNGTVIWVFHLISDLVGSHTTAGLSGGTGIPGPILSMAKEISVLPVFREICIDDQSLSAVLSKLFNGTLLAKHDAEGKVIKDAILKFDFRGELGFLHEVGKQSVPVIVNDCIVRSFFFIRRFANELEDNEITKVKDLSKIDFDNVKPWNNPTLSRMLFVSSGVFCTMDFADAIISKKYFISVNYVGIGRFTVAVGSEVVDVLKIRDLKKIKKMYEHIELYTYTSIDKKKYERLVNDMDIDKFGLTLEQTEILYNLEYYKTLNDIEKTKVLINNEKVTELKTAWLDEWKSFITVGFPGFMRDDNAVIHWYEKDELLSIINNNTPEEVWLRLVLLEAMLFEPYYALGVEKDKNGKDVPSKKYKDLQNPVNGYKKSEGDRFLEELFAGKSFYEQGYIKRLRKTYEKCLRELNEVLKATLTGFGITAGIVLVSVITAGMFAPAIAVLLVGSNFAGLSGAALTSACLAYLGGGAIAAGGLGMAGGTMAIVGGGAILGLGVGAGVGGTVGAIGVIGKQATIMQSAKLMVSVREIFLNDEHDIDYSNTVYEQYVTNAKNLENDLERDKALEKVADKDEKKQLKQRIKDEEESLHAMKIAIKSMNKFKSAFEVGMEVEDKDSVEKEQ